VLLALAGSGFYPVSSTVASRETASLVWVDADRPVERTACESQCLPAYAPPQLPRMTAEPAAAPDAGFVTSLFQRPPPHSAFFFA